MSRWRKLGCTVLLDVGAAGRHQAALLDTLASIEAHTQAGVALGKAEFFFGGSEEVWQDASYDLEGRTAAIWICNSSAKAHALTSYVRYVETQGECWQQYVHDK